MSEVPLYQPRQAVLHAQPRLLNIITIINFLFITLTCNVEPGMMC